MIPCFIIHFLNILSQSRFFYDFVTNLKIRNLKIKMLVHTKPSLGAKKIYSTKLKIFFSHSLKIEAPNDQPLPYEEKQVHGDFHN